MRAAMWEAAVKTALVSALGYAGPVQAQTLAYQAQDRGPRFLLASSNGTEHAAVDVARTPILKRRLSLAFEGVTVKQALGEISLQSGLQLVYNDRILPPHGRVYLRTDGISVAAALTEVLLDANIDVVLESAVKAALVRRPQRQTGTIIGRVIDARSGEGLPEALVRVEGTELSASTGADGTYRVPRVAPGSHSVNARRIGYVKLTQEVMVLADQEVMADFALEPAPTRLDELVTVTPGGTQAQAKALPTPVTVVTAAEIEAQAPRTLQQLFRQVVPGAVSWDFTSRPSVATFSVRGASTLNPGGTQTKVFIDDIQAADANVSLLDPQSIERIEVIRGPQAAAVYGSDAIGGVIQVYTKRGINGSRPLLQGEVSYGVVQTPYASPDGAVRQQYSANLSGGTTNATYNVGASYWRLGNWVPPRNETSAQSAPSAFGGVRYIKGPLTLDVSGRYGASKYGGNVNPELLTSGFVSFSQPQLSVLQFISTSLGIRLGVTALSGWTHTVTAGFDNLESRTDRRQPRFTTPADSFLSVLIVDQHRRWIGYSTTFEFRSGLSWSAAFTGGLDHNSQPQNALSTEAATPGTPVLPAPFAYDLNTHNTGYFLQGQLGLHDALFITAGLRAEQNTNFGDSLGTPISPRVGFSYVRDLRNLTAKVRGSWGRAIRAPDPSLKLSVGPDLIPNPRLAPERQRGWDAGVDLQFGNRGSLGLTYYDQVAENLLQQVPIQTQPTLVHQFQNVGRVRNRGVELEATARAAWLEANASYAYTRARIEDLGPGYTGDLVVGDQVRVTPKHTAGVSLTATPATGTTVTLGLAYVGSYSQTDFLALFRCLGGTGDCTPDFRFVTTYPDFAKLRIGWKQRLAGGISALVRIDNLTNTTAPENGNIFAVMGRVTTIGLRFER